MGKLRSDDGCRLHLARRLPPESPRADSPRRAVLFDLDGVLVDTERPALAALGIVFGEQGLSLPPDAARHLCGKTAADAIQVVTEWVGDRDLAVGLLKKRGELLARQMRDGGVHAFPGAHDLLLMLRQRGWPCAVASSSSRTNIYWKLEQAGLAYLLPVVVGGDQVRRGKPDPEIFLRAAAALGVRSSQCTVVEDSPAGVEAARRAGMRCIAVTHTFPADDLKAADILVPSLKQLGLRELGSEGGV